MRVIARLNMGGPAKHVGVLSGARMESRGYETVLVHGSLAPGEESLQQFAEGEGAELVYLPELAQPVSPISDLRALRALAGLMRRFKPDIVHTHTAKGGFIGRSAALMVKPRPLIVHTYHGHVLEGYFGPAKALVYRNLEAAAARISDRLIGVSQATVDDLVRLDVAPRERFSVVRLGLLLDEFANLDRVPDPEARLELGIEGKDLLFAYVGRIAPIKRLDLMLEAVASVHENGCEIQLAIVGDGEDRPVLEAMARELGIADRVHFLGYRDDLVRIAAASDALILSSDNEGTPVSLIEGSAAARPCVTTNVGGVREVVSEETGVLVPPDNVAALAAGIERLAGDPELRARMGARARERALNKFTAERLVGDIDSLYRELLGEPATVGDTAGRTA